MTTQKGTSVNLPSLSAPLGAVTGDCAADNVTAGAPTIIEREDATDADA